jgi:predicted transcriptional regulator
MEGRDTVVELTVEIVAAYVANNPVAQSDLPKLITDVYRSLAGAAAQPNDQKLESNDAKPAVTVRKSVTPDDLVCLEDGKKFKSVKRHLRTHHNLSPEQYREKWNLPNDYPMVAPSYAQARSTLAKKIGLGRRRVSSKR